MKIVLDLQAAQRLGPSATAEYSLEFAKAVATRAGQDEVWLLLNSAFPESIENLRAVFDNLVPQSRIRLFDVPSPVAANDPKNSWRRHTAEHIREAVLAEIAPDIIHCGDMFGGWADNEVTSIGCFERASPVAVSLFNLPHFVSGDCERFYYRGLQSLKNADVIFTATASSRRAVLERLHLLPRNVISISAGVCGEFRKLRYSAEASADLLGHFMISKPFFMSIANGHGHRKGLIALLQAFAMLPASVRDSHQLVLAGEIAGEERQALLRQAESSGLGDAIIFPGCLQAADRIGLFNLCSGALFPALDDPAGLLALEAMACGAAVIGADTGAIFEIIGNGNAIFDPAEPAAISVSLKRLAEDESFRQSLRQTGALQAKKFSWESCAEKALEAFRGIDDRERLAKTGLAIAPPRVKPRLAFVSPLPPSRSGVSDYSAELLPALAAYYDIDVIPTESDVASEWIAANFAVRSIAWFEKNGASFDRIIYQFGNSHFHHHMIDLLAQHPGTVVLHDFFLSDLISGYFSGANDLFRRALYESHGYPALLDERTEGRDAAIRKYPINIQIIEAASGIIVHSRYALAQARHWYNPHIGGFAVISQLRAMPPATGKISRAPLGIAGDDFVFIACGFIDPNKMGDRLAAAWLASPCADDPHCRLIFVGEYNKGPFGETMRRTVSSSRSKISVTGYVTAEKYAAYQSVADAAVQLRTRSRGETSRAVLDCLAHGLPTIINANGAMAEIPGDAAIVIPDDFTDQELIGALLLARSDHAKREELSCNAKAFVAQECNPAHLAGLYAEAIESFFHSDRKFRENRLLRSLSRLRGPHSSSDINAVAASVDRSRVALNRGPILFYDVSAMARDDLKTGIQRVTRNVLCALLQSGHRDYRIEPVYDDGDVVRYARDFTLDAIGMSNPGFEDDVADVSPGDIFVAVDFDALGIVRNAARLRAWRAAGVKICFVIYDILPITNPEFFPPGAAAPHAAWLETAMEVADCLACISQTVAGQVRQWTGQHNSPRRRPLEISWFHLGADIRPSAAQPLPKGLSAAFGHVPTLLMVGTIEPRKGHLQVLDAVELLWSRGIDIKLIIVGGEGWVHLPDRHRRTIPAILRRLRDHPERNKRLFWAEALSDGDLESVYKAATCLLAASEGEGFGLPLIEAAQYGLPIIARDIPVFREVAGDAAFYFDGIAPDDLAGAILAWLELHRARRAPDPARMRWITWAESAQQLQKIIARREANGGPL